MFKLNRVYFKILNSSPRVFFFTQERKKKQKYVRVHVKSNYIKGQCFSLFWYYLKKDKTAGNCKINKKSLKLCRNEDTVAYITYLQTMIGHEKFNQDFNISEVTADINNIRPISVSNIFSGI